VDQLNRTFGALADPTRRELLARLAHGTATVTELAAPLDMTMQGVSRHLQVLEHAGLISRGRQGNGGPVHFGPSGYATPVNGWTSTAGSGRAASTGSPTTCMTARRTSNSRQKQVGITDAGGANGRGVRTPSNVEVEPQRVVQLHLELSRDATEDPPHSLYRHRAHLLGLRLEVRAQPRLLCGPERPGRGAPGPRCS
jgi:DNA-binding transcriptional ArsR family regulator